MPSSDVTTQKLIYANVSVHTFPALNVTREDFSLGFCERVFKAAKMKCEVCLQPILKATDIDAIHGKSTSCSWLEEELKLLKIPHQSDGFLCNACRRRVEKYRKIKENLKKCEEKIRSSSCSSACTKENTQKEENTELDSPLSSPAKKKRCILYPDVSLNSPADFAPLSASTPEKATLPDPPPFRLTQEKPKRIVKVRELSNNDLFVIIT